MADGVRLDIDIIPIGIAITGLILIPCVQTLVVAHAFFGLTALESLYFANVLIAERRCTS